MLSRDSVDQLLYVLRLFRERYETGQPLRKAYRQAVRQAADHYGVAYQTLGDLCRRRLNLARISEFYALLQRWVDDDAGPLAACLAAASAVSAHEDIDVFFRAELGSGADASTGASNELERISFRLPVREARMLRALAELEGIQPPDLLRQILGSAVKNRMTRVVEEIAAQPGSNKAKPQVPTPTERRPDAIVSILRDHSAELRRLGVEHLALFGSAARGEAGPSSDVDVAVTVAPDVSAGGFARLARIDAVRDRLREILAAPVDVIEEPVENPRLQRQINEDRVVAF